MKNNFYLNMKLKTLVSVPKKTFVSNKENWTFTVVFW